MERNRFIDGKVHAVTEYQGVRSFMASNRVPQGYITIHESGLPIDILSQNRGHDTTIIFLHGAIDSSWRLPVAAGLGVSRDVEVNRIFVTDPSLYMSKDLTLGWFAGNRHQRLQPILVDVLNKIVESFGSQRIVFFGTSGGGFASLYYSAQFKGSMAIAVNPQTAIERHTPSAVQRYTDACFENVGAQPSLNLPYDVTTDLIEIYSHPVDNTVAYMQNATDDYHIRVHESPFFNELHSSNDVWCLRGDDWGTGHIAAPKDLTTRVLVASTAEDRSLSLSGLGFIRFELSSDANLS